MKKIQVFFDGGIRPHPNGGYARCYGWLIKSDGETLTKGRAIEIGDDDIGSCAVEFEALARALKDAAVMAQEASQVDVHGDSRAVIDMCAGVGVPHTDDMAASHKRVSSLASVFPKLNFKWIPRELNGEADKLGRVAFAESSSQDARIDLMNQVNARARRQFGSFYDKASMSEWCASITGKRKLATMSVGELSALLRQVCQIPNFIRDYVARCNTAAQAATV